jgi:TRAP-type C4-dicarboxylate transport system substrate-binding protein
MGRKSWDKLSKEEQAMVMDAASEAKRFKRDQLALLERQWLEASKKAGMQVNEVSLAERERMAVRLKPVIDRQNEKVGEDFARQFYAETKKQRVAAK